MAKVRIRYRLWHLLLVVLLASVCMWAITQYGMRQCTVVVEKYRTVSISPANESKLQVMFRFKQPAALAGPLHDYALVKVPNEILPKELTSGRRFQFRYREKPLRIGLGKWAFWEAKPEDPFNKFWLVLFEKPNRPFNANELRVLHSVMR